MQMVAVAALLALAGLGDQGSSDEAELEQAIRQALVEQQAQVYRIEMNRRDADNLTGYADIRDSEGHEGRLNCTARRGENDNYDWSCLPAVTESIVRDMEAEIRTALARQGRVLQVDLTRQDDMRMTGFARLRGGDGIEVRTVCAATREAPESRTFNWECNPEE